MYCGCKIEFNSSVSQEVGVLNIHEICLQMQLYPDVETYEDKIKFVSLLEMLLHLNPQRRTTPNDALVHPCLSTCKLCDATSFE